MNLNIEHIPSLDADALAELSFHSRLFLTLSAPTCRYAIYYFVAHEESTATSDELVAGIQTIAAAVDDQPRTIATDELRTLIVEQTIPYLACLDAFEYDSRTDLVRYHWHPTLEEYAEHAAIQELSADFVREQLFSLSD